MNGNDIVDLKIAKVPGGLRGSRYIDKIFTPADRDLINSDRVGVWAIWAMKEAVYKAHHRRFNLPRSFDPKIIKVDIQESSGIPIIAVAEYLGYVYWGEGLLTSDYVYFTATCLPQEKLYSEIHKNSSLNIKSRLKQAISEKLELEIEELEIVKDDNFIPQIRFQKLDLNLPFSISHHGEYAAFSFQLINY